MAKIELNDVGLTFTIRQNKHVTLKEYLVRGLLFKSVAQPGLSVRALSGLTLRVADGDRLGVIGHNGAGKSTLLKLLAGIYPPTAGVCAVEGRVCSLFDITLGFEPEASGWENITYRAYLQGESPASLKRKMAGIAEFSELGDFLDVPVRYYSAGMMMRLAFSIATAIEPEILLIDEVLSTGDLSFHNKAKARMAEMMSTARMMVLVAHDLDTVRSVCNRAVWLQHGSIAREGTPDEVVDAYVRSVNGGRDPSPHVGGVTAATALAAA